MANPYTHDLSNPNEAERLADALGGHRVGNHFEAHCPAHDDHHPSLRITEKNGKVLVKCWTGCNQAAVMAALTERGLWGAGEGVRSTPKPLGRLDTVAGLTVEQLAEHKKLPVDFLHGLSLSTITYVSRPAVRIPYMDEFGKVCATRFRVALEKEAGVDRFRWKKNDKPCLYGLWRLPEARERGYVVLVEGESDCHTLWYHDFPAIGVPGASNWRQERDEPMLDGIEKIFVVKEPDEGGTTLLERLTRSALADRLFVINDLEDVSALYLSDPELFTERFETSMASAIPWVDIRDAESIQAMKDEFRKAKDLLESPNLLKTVEQAISDGGYAGDVSPAIIAFLAITSRQLERPVNVTFVAQSSAGKSRSVEAATELHPPDAVFKMDAGSPRALIYNDESYEHKAVCVAEADSLPEDGPAASAIRAIAETNQMTYDVVETDPETSRKFTRRIVKQGPTCLITTAVRSPKAQLGTRMFEVPITDDEAQTRAIMAEQARRVSGQPLPSRDLEPFHALQRWIGMQKPLEPIIPFSKALADLLPANQVRLRRDLTKVFTFIKASALLHQLQRERDPVGRIICTVDDYANVQPLLAPIFDAVVADGVTPAIRETVQAVPEGSEISQAALATILGLSKQAISYRVRKAVRDGWLVKNDQRQGHAAKIARGTPLPDERAALPTAVQLQQASNRQTSEVVSYTSPLPSAQLCPECDRRDAGCHYDDEFDVWVCAKW